MLKNLICLFLFIILAGCINTRTEKAKEVLSGEIISICEDSVLTQWVDGKWYKQFVLKFKIKNNSSRIYYTKLNGEDSSLVYINSTDYHIAGDSVLSINFNCFGYLKDSILSNESKVYFSKVLPRDNVNKVKNEYLFSSEEGDTTNKNIAIPLIFDLTKMINCDSSVLNSSIK